MTHLCMNGAPSLHITDYEDFYSTYINQVKNGKKLYLVETKTPLFRFFIDLDYIGPEKLSKAEIISAVKRIASAIKGRCVCSISAPTAKGDFIKTGIHIHFPECIVTRQKALKMKNLIPEDLLRYVDDSVYKGSGLRMLWSYKKDGGAPYVPFYDVNNDAYMDQQPSIECLKLFTIKTEYDMVIDNTIESGEFDVIQQFIQRCMIGYSCACVKRIVKDHETFIIHTDSRFCENMQRDHKSNHIYFIADTERGRIWQKCFDEDCKAFKGREYRLTNSALEQLKRI